MKQLLLQAASGEKTKETPIWLMRQAGRYLPEYQELRETYSFSDLCKMPTLAVRASLEPYERFGMDGVIIFSDIMIPAEAMGISIDFSPGPQIGFPIRSLNHIEALKIPDPGTDLKFVLDTLRILRNEISESSTLIGFCGGPFTTASYMVEGKHIPGFPTFLKFLNEAPQEAALLLEKLTQTLTLYLKAQAKAGADIVQIFESGAYLATEQQYEKFIFPYQKKIMDALKAEEVPVILFVKETARFLNQIKKLEAPVVSVDQGCLLAEAKQIFGKTPLQGNLDPAVLCGTKEEIRAAAQTILRQMKSHPHIFNLGHGVLKETPPKNVSYLVEVVRNGL